MLVTPPHQVSGESWSPRASAAVDRPRGVSASLAPVPTSPTTRSMDARSPTAARPTRAGPNSAGKRPRPRQRRSSGPRKSPRRRSRRTNGWMGGRCAQDWRSPRPRSPLERKAGALWWTPSGAPSVPVRAHRPLLGRSPQNHGVSPSPAPIQTARRLSLRAISLVPLRGTGGRRPWAAALGGPKPQRGGTARGGEAAACARRKIGSGGWFVGGEAVAALVDGDATATQCQSYPVRLLPKRSLSAG